MRTVPPIMVILATVGGVTGGGPASAQDFAGDEPAFRIGMVARDGTPAIEVLSIIKRAYEGALERPVDIYVARDQSALVEAHLQGRVDYAMYSAAAFAAASLRCGCVRAVAAPILRNGAIGIRSVLLKRVDAPGDVPDGLAVGPTDSLAGRLAPLALHPRSGDKAFGATLVEARSMSEAEALFMAGQTGSLFGWVLAWRDDIAPPDGGTVTRLRQAGLAAADYSVDWQSEPIRFGPHAVRADLDEESVKRIRSLLTGAGNPDLLSWLDRNHQGGFIAVDTDAYEPMRDIVRSLAR